MPDNTRIIHLGSGEGDAFSVMGDVYRNLALGRQTGGAYTLHEIRVSPNNGTFIQGPRGIAHSSKNNTQLPARMLVFITPAGFENFVNEFAQPVASFDSPAIPASKDEIDKLLAAAPKYGLQILPSTKQKRIPCS
jgi:hypothetical protein